MKRNEKWKETETKREGRKEMVGANGKMRDRIRVIRDMIEANRV